MTRILVTGSAGFIGFHLCRLLLSQGATVLGLDGMTDYYDVALKRRRHAILRGEPGFTAVEAMLDDPAAAAAVTAFRPEIIVHLAAQAGVRYSLENPRSYVDSNVTGSFLVLDWARAAGVRHLLMASTSSVYGANPDLPFRESDKADLPLTIYAATKKAMEAMAHSWAHVNRVPVTLFRFFTVYGPWGRPDMALFKFTDAILSDRPIELYNGGQMARDFTYVGDLVQAISRLVAVVPGDAPAVEGDSLSPVAPCRVVNIGNGQPVGLEAFVAVLEDCLGRKAQRNLLPMQTGDVPATWADVTLLERLTGARPQTPLRDGVAAFVDWFRDYYGR